MRLYKSLTSEDHAKSFCDGSILLRSIEYYRSYPLMSENSEKIRDSQELSFHSNKYISSLATIPSMQSMLILSTHTEPPEYETHIVEIIDSKCFFDEISNTLNGAYCFSPPDASCFFGTVCYYDPKNNQTDISCTIPDQYWQYGFLKNVSFSSQKEARMIFFVQPEKLHQVTFYERTLCEKCLMFSDNCLPFNEWLARKKCCRNYGDNYWLELKIKISPLNFCIFKK